MRTRDPFIAAMYSGGDGACGFGGPPMRDSDLFEFQCARGPDDHRTCDTVDQLRRFREALDLGEDDVQVPRDLRIDLRAEAACYPAGLYLRTFDSSSAPWECTLSALIRHRPRRSFWRDVSALWPDVATYALALGLDLDVCATTWPTVAHE